MDLNNMDGNEYALIPQKLITRPRVEFGVDYLGKRRVLLRETRPLGNGLHLNETLELWWINKTTDDHTRSRENSMVIAYWQHNGTLPSSRPGFTKTICYGVNLIRDFFWQYGKEIDCYFAVSAPSMTVRQLGCGQSYVSVDPETAKRLRLLALLPQVNSLVIEMEHQSLFSAAEHLQKAALLMMQDHGITTEPHQHHQDA